MPARSPALRGVHRRLAFPPPPARPSLAVFRELKGADDDLAWALFFLSRRVRDAADAPPAGVARWTHASDVRAAAANAPDIAADLLLLGAPDFSLTEGMRGRAAGACHRLAAWASEQGYAELAIQLAETAVAILPGSARHAYEAGRINRLFGRAGDAEALYNRAITLARPGKHWWVYVRAHLGLGQICKMHGQLDHAAAHFATAARRAWDKSGEKWLAAMIEHDLLAVMAEAGEFEAAHFHAARAFEWMPVHHERLPFLVHDYAFLLLRTGTTDLAIKLLDDLTVRRLPTAAMVLIWSTLGRAAALYGDSSRFREAEQHVSTMTERFCTHASAAYANLAMGAYVLDLRDEAERHALRSAELARASDHHKVLADVTELLMTIRSGERAPLPVLEPVVARAERLANDLSTRLKAWRGPTWKRKRQAGQGSLGVV